MEPHQKQMIDAMRRAGDTVVPGTARVEERYGEGNWFVVGTDTLSEEVEVLRCPERADATEISGRLNDAKEVDYERVLQSQAGVPGPDWLEVDWRR